MGVLAMSFLVLRAYLKLIQFDLYLARGDFKRCTRKCGLSGPESASAGECS